MLGLFVLALVFYYIFIGDTSLLRLPNIFHGRDLNRAFNLIHNREWIWHGPELTGGGQLPGPFYYYLLGMPLYFFDTYPAIVYFQFLLAALSSVVLWKFVARYSVMGAYLVYFFFIGSPFILSLINTSWNPSFLVLFTVVSISLLSRPHNPRTLFCAGVILGLSLQIHFMQIIFVVASIADLALHQSPLQKRINSISSLLSGIFLTLLPYLAYRVFYPASFSTDSSFTAGVWAFFSQAFQTGDDTAKSLEYLQGLFTFRAQDVLILPMMLLSLIFFKSVLRQNRFIAFSFGLSVLLVVWVAHASQLSRYLLPVVLLTGVIGAMAAPQDLAGKNWRFPALLSAMAALGFLMRFYGDPDFSIQFSLPLLQVHWPFFAIGVFTALILITKPAEKFIFIILLLLTFGNTSYLSEIRQNHYYNNRNTADFLRVGKAENLLREIISTTGWTYEQFRERTFVKSSGRLEDYSFFYNWVDRRHGPFTPQNFDGLILETRLKTTTNIAPELKNALSNGEIHCAKKISIEDFELCFYRFSDSHIRKINNLGYAYGYTQPALLTITQAEGVQELNSDQALFYVNQCAGFEPSCSVYFRVTLASSYLLIEALGDPIAAPAASVNPAYAVNIKQPAVTAICGDVAQNFEIASVLGFEPTRTSVLAPYDVFFKLPCARPAKVVLSLAKYQTVVNDVIYRKGKPIELTWRLQ